MSAVTPFLWFDDAAEEAVTFYTGLIPDSELVTIDRYPDEVPGMGGKVMHVHFRLGGRDYFGMDAGPQFPFTEAVSLYVACRDQAEVDRYWDALTADGGPYFNAVTGDFFGTLGTRILRGRAITDADHATADQ